MVAPPQRPRSAAVVAAGLALVALGLLRGADGLALARRNGWAAALVVPLALGAVVAGIALIVRRRSGFELLVAALIAIAAGSVAAGRIPLVSRRTLAFLAVAVIVAVAWAYWSRVLDRK